MLTTFRQSIKYSYYAFGRWLINRPNPVWSTLYAKYVWGSLEQKFILIKWMYRKEKRWGSRGERYRKWWYVKRTRKVSKAFFLPKWLSSEVALRSIFSTFEPIKWGVYFWRLLPKYLGFRLWWTNQTQPGWLEYLTRWYRNSQYRTNFTILTSRVWLARQWKVTFGDGSLYLRGLFIIFFIDACLTDDEPLWEPIEWSLVQSWILFIFLFAWIAENLISSRYGSYTGRDKRVWFSWYKTFWLVEGWYLISLGAAALWVMVPHYHEVTYSMSFMVSWWNWFSRVFFLKFVALYSYTLLLAYYLQVSMRWWNWKKSLVFIALISLILFYLLYLHFFLSMFAYFTDPSWYTKTCWVDYVQVSHEPNKWSWGAAKRDHFSYHNSKTTFWFKNDGPFASAMLFFNIFFFISLFLLLFFWMTLLRRVYTTQEVTFTLATYCISSLRQFFYFFAFLFLFVIISYVFQYARMPNEFMWGLNSYSWWWNLYTIVLDYPKFLLGILYSAL